MSSSSTGPGFGRVPPEVAEAVSDGRWQEQTVNRLGKRVYRITGRTEGPDRILKIQPPTTLGPGVPTLEDERARLEWLAGHLAAPPVVAAATNEVGTAFLVTEVLPGEDGAHLLHRVDSSRTVRAFGEALAALHALPVEGCPFDGRIERRLADARARVEADLVVRDRLDPPYRRHEPSRLLEVLEGSVPDGEDLVVAHGDYALDNVVLDDGAVVGYLDVGRLGVADRHVDLALAARSLARLVSPEAIPPFLLAYGLAWPDSRKIDFYVLLREFF